MFSRQRVLLLLLEYMTISNIWYEKHNQYNLYPVFLGAHGTALKKKWGVHINQPAREREKRKPNMYSIYLF